MTPAVAAAAHRALRDRSAAAADRSRPAAAVDDAGRPRLVPSRDGPPGAYQLAPHAHEQRRTADHAVAVPGGLQQNPAT